MEDGNYYSGIMALPLVDEFLDNIKKGTVYFSDSMSPDEHSFAEFDARFPIKNKETTPSQAEFSAAVGEIGLHDYRA